MDKQECQAAEKPWRQQGKAPPVCLCVCEASRVTTAEPGLQGSSSVSEYFLFPPVSAAAGPGSELAAHVTEPLL